MNEAICLTVSFEHGVGRFKERAVTFTEGSGLTLEGFPAIYHGWSVKAVNGDASASFKIGKNGAFTIKDGSSVLKEGILYLTAKNIVGGSVVDFAKIEPLTITKDQGEDLLKPTFDILFEELDILKKKIQLIEDMHLGFDFNI